MNAWPSALVKRSCVGRHRRREDAHRPRELRSGDRRREERLRAGQEIGRRDRSGRRREAPRRRHADRLHDLEKVIGVRFDVDRKARVRLPAALDLGRRSGSSRGRGSVRRSTRASGPSASTTCISTHGSSLASARWRTSSAQGVDRRGHALGGAPPTRAGRARRRRSHGRPSEIAVASIACPSRLPVRPSSHRVARLSQPSPEPARRAASSSIRPCSSSMKSPSPSAPATVAAPKTRARPCSAITRRCAAQ